ncbi:MAG: TIGR00159 family protein [Alphaproteobacteria bacterium]|nr:TIGR00159 family protein [Alphaproteobacteria bacterium]
MESWRTWLSETPLGTATFVDWLDVLLLAALLYAVIRVLRGTRALQSLLGLGVAGFVYLAAQAAGLTTLKWVLDGLLVYAVLVVIILFQEDIRRVLVQAGNTIFAGSAAQGLADANLREEVIKAMFALANRKIGALVALERAASLEPYAEGAHPVDAVVTTELLQSLFHPSSPVHDGAIVVREGRVSKAGVFLPISLTKDLPKVYGTRHRAAIGLTERTDAICLLVSEERGTVAVVSDGRVEPVSDPNDLRQKLEEVLGRTVASPAPEVVRA